MQDNGDELVLEAVGELLAAVVKVAGAEYAQIWHKEHCKPVLNCLKPSKPTAVRLAAMGAPSPYPCLATHFIPAQPLMQHCVAEALAVC